MKIKSSILLAGVLLAFSQNLRAQSDIYPEHFDLDEVTLLDGPLKTAMDINNKLLLEYDADRLLTPFIRQAGLSKKSGSKYNGWETKHPSFSNWGQSSWSLEGHVGGHYLTALALAYAATDDAATKTKMKECLDYCLNILKDCQDAYDSNTQGMYGFIGGQPINQIWTGLYANDLTAFRQYGGWVPFYCEHKVLAGLRDAWLYTKSEVAKELYRKLCDWSVNVVSKLNTSDMQTVLGWEHGGMNETLADAYKIFGDKKYLTAAKKFSHNTMVENMQTLNTTFLDGKHANTQVPKYIGFERIYQLDNTATTYQKAAHNFWQDVVEHRTVAIGGNSVSEHFLAANRGSQYMENLEGPESCNSNNMLKLSEDLFDETHDAKYADFYESTTWNHILSTQDPKTGGYVYFTTLRPQSYRIYSKVNQGMWCCVGTGMENHAKYGHFIYTHSTDNGTLYVNQFTASKLNSDKFGVTQTTEFPFVQSTKLTIDKGSFNLAVRHPAWVGNDFSVSVNGKKQSVSVKEGVASYVQVKVKKGDVVEINLPMSLRYEECPNYTDYVAFKYGPILLAAQTTAMNAADAKATGLEYEQLKNEYAGEGRMDHSPGAMATSKSLSSAPLLIGNRSDLLQRIKKVGDLTFTIDAKSTQSKGNWDKLTLVPFYQIQHARYSCYWYAQTAEAYEQSDMGKADAAAAALIARTIDYVATGEQQSEAGHEASYSTNSSYGSYNGEFYRDAQRNGYVQYTLQNKSLVKDSLAIMCRFTTADKGRVGTIYINGVKLQTVTIPSRHKNAESNGFYNVEIELPKEMAVNADGSAKSQFVFRFVAENNTVLPGLYYLRLVSGYDGKFYKFQATNWKTGDSGRVSQNNISYNTTDNIITVKASGNNNVCLMLDYENLEYNVKAAQKYFTVIGEGLNLSSGKSYLWWLNGVNQGSQVPPTTTRSSGTKKIVVWDITQSGLDGNCTGDEWNFCTGATIFGLTSTSGTARISYIGFLSSLDEIDELLAVNDIEMESTNKLPKHYISLDGIAHSAPVEGINIVNGKKVLVK